MAKRWRIHPHDPARIAALERAAGIPAVVAELLICRGVSDPAAVRDFLDPKLSASATRSSARLPCRRPSGFRPPSAARRPIAVYGDYDVDGMTGTAILWLCLKLLGAEVRLLRSPPHRRGLRAQRRGDPHAGRRQGRIAGDRRLRHRQQRRSGAGPRTGRRTDRSPTITSPGRGCPQAAAIVHPRLPGGDYPFGGLSGSGVALKLAWALCQQASGAKRVAPRMKDFLAPGRGSGRPGHRGRRGAAGRREPRAGPSRPGEPGQCAHARHRPR